MLIGCYLLAYLQPNMLFARPPELEEYEATVSTQQERMSQLTGDVPTFKGWEEPRTEQLSSFISLVHRRTGATTASKFPSQSQGTFHSTANG